ncbi:MAG: hypothetical protein PHY94_07760, partial [Candidatus Omnitrophica bacterium]|nr:hypothetical protein [Candidatus Omnitrophota bacterium]
MLRQWYQGRHLVSFVGIDPALEYMVKTYFDPEQRQYVLNKWLEEGCAVAKKRLNGLAVATFVVNATGGDKKPFAFFVEGVGTKHTDIAVVQKRVVPLTEILRQYIAAGQIQLAHSLIDEFKKIFILIFRRGVIDTDFGAPLDNYGREPVSNKLLIFDFGDITSGIDPAYEFVDSLDYVNEYIEHTLRAEFSQEVADYFKSNSFRESDFYDENRKFLFGVDYQAGNPDIFKMEFPYSEDQIRALFLGLPDNNGEGSVLQGASSFIDDPARAQPPLGDSQKFELANILEEFKAEILGLANDPDFDPYRQAAIELAQDRGDSGIIQVLKDAIIARAPAQLKQKVEAEFPGRKFFTLNYQPNIILILSSQEIIISLIYEASALLGKENYENDQLAGEYSISLECAADSIISRHQGMAYFRPIIRELLFEFGSIRNFKDKNGVELGPDNRLGLLRYLRSNEVHADVAGVGRNFSGEEAPYLHPAADYNEYFNVGYPQGTLDFIYARLSLYAFKYQESLTGIARYRRLKERYLALHRALKTGGIIISLRFSGDEKEEGLSAEETKYLGFELVTSYTLGQDVAPVTITVLRKAGPVTPVLKMQKHYFGMLEEFIHEQGISYLPALDGLTYAAVPYQGWFDVFEQLTKISGSLIGKNYLSITPGDLKNALIACQYGLKTTVVEVNQQHYLEDLNILPPAREQGFAKEDSLKLSLTRNAFDISWQDFDFVCLAYPELNNFRQGEILRKRIISRAQEMKLEGILAILFTTEQLAAGLAEFIQLEPLLSDPERISEVKGGIYLQLYHAPAGPLDISPVIPKPDFSASGDSSLTREKVDRIIAETLASGRYHRAPDEDFVNDLVKSFFLYSPNSDLYRRISIALENVRIELYICSGLPHDGYWQIDGNQERGFTLKIFLDQERTEEHFSAKLMHETAAAITATFVEPASGEIRSTSHGTNLEIEKDYDFWAAAEWGESLGRPVPLRQYIFNEASTMEISGKRGAKTPDLTGSSEDETPELSWFGLQRRGFGVLGDCHTTQDKIIGSFSSPDVQLEAMRLQRWYCSVIKPTQKTGKIEGIEESLRALGRIEKRIVERSLHMKDLSNDERTHFRRFLNRV